MPALLLFFLTAFAFSESLGWRAAMATAGAVCFFTGIAYYFLTQDAPDGDYKDLRAAGKLAAGEKTSGAFLAACKDHRVWTLFVIYGACFGVELTMYNVLARYFSNYFGLGLFWAGLAAASYGLMNLFARTLGCVMGDKFAGRWGLRGRVTWLFAALFIEGLALMVFSQMTAILLAIPALIVSALFVQMSNGGRPIQSYPS